MFTLILNQRVFVLERLMDMYLACVVPAKQTVDKSSRERRGRPSADAQYYSLQPCITLVLMPQMTWHILLCKWSALEREITVTQSANEITGELQQNSLKNVTLKVFQRSKAVTHLFM